MSPARGNSPKNAVKALGSRGSHTHKLLPTPHSHSTTSSASCTDNPAGKPTPKQHKLCRTTGPRCLSEHKKPAFASEQPEISTLPPPAFDTGAGCWQLSRALGCHPSPDPAHPSYSWNVRSAELTPLLAGTTAGKRGPSEILLLQSGAALSSRSGLLLRL